ncbi:uncharacterized protein PADG_07353 [Paracoccidioides brasiliensis Pb18]|uniref:SRR1-like domain-containing protein n=1 Tax=Paracoccidioides brasiliensis (strain Pb18) TaxID=502780 RepID=C1GJB7_PARBD|nr:uncharacterized protein PADG_07353 [Paracoccidioides brasiliensis Pb18]EEH42533.2 hypothetical protein PADG_07353 [Paracoccidioides brasiliensis Pb18]
MEMRQSSARRKGRSCQPKRVQVHDDDGWTHITTTRHATANKPCLPPVRDVLAPAEAPDGLSLKTLKKQFEWHKKVWEESQSWKTLREVLGTALSTGALRTIDKCVCVGLGSPSGFLRGGWVDRRAVSLYQLAALVTILEYFAWEDTPSNAIKDCYAQDPVFNMLDKQLLESVGVHVVEDPKAFALINEGTFLYSPGAERSHLLVMLSSNPALFFGGPLDGENLVRLPDTREDVLSGFLKSRRSMLLPPFDSNVNAFWMTSLFWRSEDT